MSVIVGSLQVDVTTGSATLTFDDAKKKLDDFGKSAEGASQKLDYSMREARESITLTGDALGVHLPGGIARAIAAIGPLGPALEAAMPVAAIVAGIVLIVEALDKMHAAAEKAALAQTNAGSAIAESMRGLDDKFLQAGIRADELSGNHLAALQKQIKLIDNQTLGDLEHEFESLGKIADTIFEDLKSHWYTVGSGSQHAKYNLDEYEASYRSLLDTKGDQSATDYLKTQLDYEQKILQAQKDAAANKYQAHPANGNMGDYAKFEEIRNTLKAAGVGWTDKEIKSQEELVTVLNSQLSATSKIQATANTTKGTDTQQAKIKIMGEEEALHKQVAAAISAHEAAARKLSETENQSSTGGKQGLEAELTGIEANRVAAIQAVDAVLAEKQRSWSLEVAAAGSNTTKIQEIENAHAAEQMAHNDAVNQADATAKVATEKAKLAAALESIKSESEARSKAYQEGMRVAGETAKEITEVQKSQNTQTADSIATSEKLGLISKREALTETIALIRQEGAERQAGLAKELSDKRAIIQAEIADEQQAAQELLAVNGGNKEDPKYKSYLEEINALLAQQAMLEQSTAAASTAAGIQTNTQIQKIQSELALLSNSWATYFTKMNKETNTLAATFRGTLQQSMTQAMNSFNNSISKSIVEGKNFGQAMRQVAASFLESMLNAGLKWLENWIIQHTIAALFAKTSAATTFDTEKAEAISLAGANAVASYALAPWPIDIGAPAFGAAMAAAATGFNAGGIVPGSGTGDTIPAMLTPGEAVFPQPMVEKLSSASETGGDHFHAHYHPTIHIKAWDSSDMKAALLDNKNEFMKHAAKEFRRRNK